MDSDIHQRLSELVATHFGKELSLSDFDHDIYETLDIDSFQALDLLSRLEEEFGIEIPDYELENVRTFNELGEVVRQRL